MIKAAAVHGNARMTGVTRKLTDGSQVIGVGNAFNGGPRRHDGANRGVTKLHGVLKNGGGLLINMALPLRVLNGTDQLFFAARFVGTGTSDPPHCAVHHIRNRAHRCKQHIDEAKERQRRNDHPRWVMTRKRARHCGGQ